MKKVLRPTLIILIIPFIPLTLGAAVLAALVAFSDPARVVAVMEGFHVRDLGQRRRCTGGGRC